MVALVLALADLCTCVLVHMLEKAAVVDNATAALRTGISLTRISSVTRSTGSLFVQTYLTACLHVNNMW
jgi:hypothetical protein